jgi:hypothetical protein
MKNMVGYEDPNGEFFIADTSGEDWKQRLRDQGYDVPEEDEMLWRP